MNPIIAPRPGRRRSRRGYNRATQPRAARRLACEKLEPRLVLTAPACVAPDCLSIPLIPELDQFGFQIDMVQAYQDADGTRATFSIFDTGASVVTFSAADQLIFDLINQAIPIKVPGGAQADAVGGTLTGDVSQPGTILADGLHAWELDPAHLLDSGFNLDAAAQADGVQAFVGTSLGSPVLPTIVGTPLLNASQRHPSGAAAMVDTQAYELDFGALFPEFPEFQGIIVHLPDLRFVDPNPDIPAPGDGSATAPVRIPLELFGEDNHLNPGNEMTTSWSPVQTSVDTYLGDHAALGKTLLLDTGAQLTVISVAMAEQLQLDLANPDIVITVQGAAGQVDIPGFTIDVLDLPRDENGDGVADGTLRFTQVPIYVLDLVEGLDGILGMNLLNPARIFVYDPHDPLGPSLRVNFETSRLIPPADPNVDAALDTLGGFFPTLAATQDGVGLPDSTRPASWQNHNDPLDVNNDGEIVPLDALLLINELNSRGARQLALPPIRPLPVQVYLDVSGDLALTPLDALLVINHINSRGAPEAEGERASDAEVSIAFGHFGGTPLELTVSGRQPAPTVLAEHAVGGGHLDVTTTDVTPESIRLSPDLYLLHEAARQPVPSHPAVPLSAALDELLGESLPDTLLNISDLGQIID